MAVFACVMAMRVRSLLHCSADSEIGSMSELIENGSKSMAIGILGAVYSLSAEISFFLSYVPKALQGAFVEHQVMFQQLSLQVEISVNLVRSVQDLQKCDALVIPGGGKLLISSWPLPLSSFSLTESTTIALLAKLSGLLDPLREFSKAKPVWGSCAGAILMSRNVTNTKKGGQDLLGRLSVTTARNGWGSQVGRPVQNHCTFSVDGDFQGRII